jgi:hypothetical protein
MVSKNKPSNSGIPAALQAYMDGLAKPAKSLYRSARPVARRAAAAGAMPAAPAAVQPVVDFIFNGLTAPDLTYDAPQYPVSGIFQGVTPPWLNDLNNIPKDWQWSSVWYVYHQQRNAQVHAETTYVNNTVPCQTYTGTKTADIIRQWYTQGMWDPSTFPQTQIDTLTQNWIASDQEFARQRLGGANPNVIKLASAGSYNIANWIGKASNAGSLSALKNTLIAAQTAGALFVCDYTGVLGNAVKKQFVVNGRYLAAPICFFSVNPSTNTLTPLAIQIVGTDPTSYIFTPGDPNDPNGDAWLLAKLWAASADQQWWFSGSHLFNAHSIDMIFGIAALNQIQIGVLPPTHPLVILTKPFLSQVFNINNLVISAPASQEKGIYQKDSFCDAVLPTGRIGLYQIISDLFQNYNFDANAFPAQMSSRGLQSGAIAKVPFPYRDDGQIWWSAIQTFVTAIVGATYPNDAAVAADKALNGWMNAVQTAFNHDGTIRFTWTPTVAYLTSAFTNLLFVCSVQHTAVNDTMFPGWAFTPNGPFAMQTAPPANAASVTQATVLGSLPNPQNPKAFSNTILNQIVFVMNGTADVTPPDTLGLDSSSVNSMLAVYPYKAGTAQETAVRNFWNAIWTGANSVNSQITNNQNARIKSWSGSTPVPNSLAYYYLSAALAPGTSPAYLNASVMNQIQI